MEKAIKYATMAALGVAAIYTVYPILFLMADLVVNKEDSLLSKAMAD